MAIYPIVKGQQNHKRMSIPPRSSISGLSSRATSTPANKAEPDLIDFGQNDTKPVGLEPPLDAAHKSTSEIQEMLSATGTKAENGGSLIDFHEDLRNHLPAGGIKRKDTSESNDEFVDALG